MKKCRQLGKAQTFAAVSFLVWLGAATVAAQQPDPASVIAQVDAAVKARVDNIESYTVTEHYAVFRGKDEIHPAAEMTVHTVYRKDSGKNYTILSESGSEFIRNHVLRTLLNNEKNINLPGVREHSWFTSANYEMQLNPGGVQLLDGRECLTLAITPRRKATNMIAGTLWVDAKDGSIVQIVGTATQSASIFTGAAKVMRQYASVNGFAMATQARAVSESYLLGRTTVTIDYRDYQIQQRPSK
jgi:outer membrane lipoprotein-sorting protein